MDRGRRDRIVQKDGDLARLVERLNDDGHPDLAEGLIDWASERDTERRSLAAEALDRYRELNLLYDLADRAASLDPSTVIAVATAELARVVRRGVGAILVVDEGTRRLLPVGDAAEGETPSSSLQAPPGFAVGEGIVGSVAAGAEGEIINDCPSDPRASAAERGLGALMVAPLRVADNVIGVLLVSAPNGAEFTAGEHRMLSAVAALTAPALDAAMTHERTLAAAKAREAELQRQLDELRNEVEERRREERVREITGSDYFQALRQQADDLRRAIDRDRPG